MHERTGLRVDPMFSAPKMRWLLDHLPAGVPIDDVRLGTVDAWLIWRLTGGAEHLCEAGNASRTLLYDIGGLDWNAELLDRLRRARARCCPTRVASDAGFGTTRNVPHIPDGTPILAVLADSHAALFGHGCTDSGHGEGHLRHRLVGDGPDREAVHHRVAGAHHVGLGDRRLAHLRPGRQHPLLRRHPGLDRRPAHRRQRRAT